MEKWKILAEAILEYKTQSLLVVDKNAKVMYLRDPQGIIFETESKYAVGKNILDIFSNMTEETSTIYQVLEDELPRINEIQTFYTYKGNKVTSITTTLPLREDGELIGALEIFEDINNYEKISKNIIELQKEEQNNDLNFGIVGAKYPSEVLEYIDFYQDELVLAVANKGNYPWPTKEEIECNVLLNQKLILRKEGSGTRFLIDESLSGKGIDSNNLNIVSLIDSNEMIKKMIELNLGISLISKIAVKNEIDLGLIKTYKIKDLELKRNFYFVYHKNRTLSPVVEAFKEFLTDWQGIEI
ncbi:MAG: hypothetical protein H0S78_10085 [Tissierellales bacterium]|nr:hypothetical protein [Tissierellales bacterium]